MPGRPMIADWLSRSPTWREARIVAEERGWALAAVGDWSWVYRSEDGGHALRITPWDPGFGEFLSLCETHENRHLPGIVADVAHDGAGQSTLMEWLDPVHADIGKKFFDDLASTDEGPMCDLRRAIESHGASVPMFQGLDANPTNVLRRPGDGTLVLTDAFWIDGPELFKLINANPGRAVGLFGADNLRNWAHLPCMDAEGTETILAQIATTGRTA